MNREAIREATLRANRSRNRYAEQQVRLFAETLRTLERGVRRTILNNRTALRAPANRHLDVLERELASLHQELKTRQNFLIQENTPETYLAGISRGIGELVKARLPNYRDLRNGEVTSLARETFAQVDRNALDFLIRYNLVLAGNVQSELEEGIRRVIFSGIATGKGVEDMVRDLGKVVLDRESFRHAGKKVFSHAQQRMALIVRTETIRAHNQGRIKFYEGIGVRQMQWLTMDDERVCPQCGPLDEKIFSFHQFPQQPIHPACRCTSVAVDVLN